MVWHSYVSKSFPKFVMIHTVKGFSVVNETEIDVFLKFPFFFYNPANVGNLNSSSSSFYKPTLDIWKFLVHIMLKPSMQDFKHDLTSMGASLVAQTVKHLPAMWETWVPFLGQEDPLEKEMALLPGKSHGRRSLIGYSP